MKPYLAILIDSFWEAVTSRVLWALLIGWSLLLVGLAPFGYVSESSYQLSRGDLRNRLGLNQKLAKGLTPQGSAAQRAISAHLDDNFKKQLELASSKPDRDERLSRISSRDIVGQLNKLLKVRDLYSAEAFPTAANRERLKPVIALAESARTDEDIEMLNRELLQIAYSADLAAPRSEQLWIGYAGLKLGDALPFSRRQANMIVERIALEIIIRLGLSFVAVFVGLIVTSPMIPETFRSGSLHLLLSKPISRPLVYLTKFLGGTVFVLVNIAYLLIGLFFLVGWRLGIWNSGLILCIPLLLFVFVIFYSVSALVGVVWNNPIICVVVCIVFWVFCLVIGVLESSLRMPATWIPQIVRFQPVGDEVLAITQSGGVKVWNEKFRVWQPAADVPESGSGRVLGPYYDEQRQRLVLRSDFLDGFGTLVTRNRNLLYVDLKPQESSGPPSDKAADKKADSSIDAASVAGQPGVEIKSADEARRKARWPSENGVEPPMQMLDFLQFDGRSLAITRNGIFEIDWDAQDTVDAANAAGGVLGNISSWLGRLQPKPFKDLSPADYQFGDSVRIAKCEQPARLFIYNSGRVDVLKLDEASGKFVVDGTRQLEGDEKQSALIAADANGCLVGREHGELILLPTHLQADSPINRLQLPAGQEVRQIVATPMANRFSIVTHSGQWWDVDAKAQTLTQVTCPWQGSVSGVTWISPEKVWVGVKPNRAVLFDVDTGVVDRSLEPALSRLDWFYRWIARPMYLVNPKPSSLNGVLQTLLSREDAGKTQLVNDDLSMARMEVEIWQPIISNLIFVAVLLGIGCLYVARREF